MGRGPENDHDLVCQTDRRGGDWDIRSGRAAFLPDSRAAETAISNRLKYYHRGPPSQVACFVNFFSVMTQEAAVWLHEIASASNHDKCDVLRIWKRALDPARSDRRRACVSQMTGGGPCCGWAAGRQRGSCIIAAF